MRFRDIQKVIADQTRPKLGNVDIGPTVGIIKTTQNNFSESSDSTIFHWNKYSYIFERAIKKGNTITNAIVVPVYSIDSFEYNNKASRDQWPSIYSFNDYQGNIAISETSPSLDGTLFDNELTNNVNNGYNLSIQGNGKSGFLPITITTNYNAAVSVWSVPYDRTPRSYISGNGILVFSANKDGFNGTFNANVPIGTIGTEIWVYVYYNRDDQNTQPDRSYIKVDTDLKNIAYNAGTKEEIFRSSPIWSIPPIVSTCDPNTKNIINTLNFSPDNDPKYLGYNIYRAEPYSTRLSIHSILNNSETYYGILVNTSDMRFFGSGGRVSIGSQDYTIKQVYNSYGNKISNGGFDTYNGSKFKDWQQVSSIPGTVAVGKVTAYPYLGDNSVGDACLKFVAQKTNTAKSYYIQSSAYIPVANISNPGLSFYYKISTGAPTSEVQLLCYSSNNGTFSTPRSYRERFTRKDSLRYDWNLFATKFATPGGGSVNDGYALPANTKYVKLKLFPYYTSTSKAQVYIDAIHFGDLKYDHIFSTPAANKIVLGLVADFEKPRSPKTAFNVNFAAANSDIINNISPVSYNSPAAHYEYAKFNGAIRVNETATNLLQNGDFSNYRNRWTTDKVNLSLVNIHSWYRSYYAHIISTSRSVQASLLQSKTSGSLVASNSFTMTMWAKSSALGQQVKMILDNNGIQNSSTWFTLSTSWGKYSIYKTFAAGGNTLRSKLMFPTPYGVADIAAVQTIQGSYNTDFILDTTNGIRRNQGLKYSSPARIDQSYGTLRLWYQPNTQYSTGPGTRTLFHYRRDANNYRKLYYKKSNSSFVYDQLLAGVATSCVVPYEFKINEPIHLAVTWDTSRSYLYVNNVKSTSAATRVITSTSSFYLGAEYDTTNPACGLIANPRIDYYTWNNNDIEIDYYANTLQPISTASLKHYNNIFIGKKLKQGNETSSVVSYVDDIGLQPDVKYSYTFAPFDSNGIEGGLSSVKSVITPRISYEYQNRNKVANSSFEINQNGQILYWSSSGANKANIIQEHDFSFHGDNACYVVVNGNLNYNYLSITDTSKPHYLTWHTFDYLGVADRVQLNFYDGRYTLLGTRNFTRANYSSVNSYSSNGDIWKRFRLKVGTPSINAATVSAMRHIGLGFTTNDLVSVVDAVQFELATVTPYRETTINTDANLPYGIVPPGSLPFGGIIGRNLYNSELAVSTSVSDADRIVIGRENTAASFAELTPSYFRWHAPGMYKNAGWNYTKHVESGVGTFGNTITFDQRFQDWAGNGANPYLIITPQNYMTYSSVANVNQRLEIISMCTPSGFVSGANLRKDNTGFYNYSKFSFSSVWRNSTGVWAFQSNGGVILQSYGGGGGGNWYYDAGVVNPSPNVSKNNAVLFGYQILGTGILRGQIPYIKVDFYCTSNYAPGFDTSNGWTYVGTKNEYFIEANTKYSYLANHARLSAAQTMAVRIGYPNYTNVTCFLSNISLKINTSNPTIYKSDSQIGTFSYLAIDGGIFG